MPRVVLHQSSRLAALWACGKEVRPWSRCTSWVTKMRRLFEKGKIRDSSSISVLCVVCWPTCWASQYRVWAASMRNSRSYDLRNSSTIAGVDMLDQQWSMWADSELINSVLWWVLSIGTKSWLDSTLWLSEWWHLCSYIFRPAAYLPVFYFAYQTIISWQCLVIWEHVVSIAGKFSEINITMLCQSSAAMHLSCTPRGCMPSQFLANKIATFITV